MRKGARLLAVLAVIVVMGALVPGVSATQPPFRDVRRGDDIAINGGTDVCGGNHWGYNLTGSTGSAGDSWISVYDTTPADGAVKNLFGDVLVWADVLIRPFNNSKGGGVLARFNEGPTDKGLALTISDAGNTDRLLLGTVSASSPAFTTLGGPTASANLNGKINECDWYRVTLYVGNGGGPGLSAWGNVYSHADPSNPASNLASLLGQVSFNGAVPAGILPTGEIGFYGRATSAVEDTTIANWWWSYPT